MNFFPKWSKLLLPFVRYCFIMGVSLAKGAAWLGEVIAILSGKGGTGKTTVCAGLATALALDGREVLCIDCDIGLRNLDISLGLSQVGSLSFLDVCQGGYGLDQTEYHPDFPTLRFLTAPVNCSAGQIDFDSFVDLLRRARRSFDYILLDAPAGVDAGFHLAASYADRALVVTGPDPASMRDAGRAGSLLELMGKDNVRLIVNRVNKKMAAAMGITIDDVMDEIGLPLAGIVPEDANVVLAAVCRKPLLLHTKRGAAAACKRIARRLQGISTPVSI